MRNSSSGSVVVAAAAVGLMSSVSVLSIAQAEEALIVGNNESIFIDGKTNKAIRGKAKGDVLAEIKKLGARELGPAVLIIRSGDKLYIADMAGDKAVMQTTTGTALAGYEPGRAASYVNDPNRPQAYEPGRVASYVNDPNRPQAYEPGRVASYVNDP